MHIRLEGPASQDEARERLVSAWEHKRFPQAILLEGPAGVGKKKLAMDLAALLSCQSETERPCGRCFGCRMARDPGSSDRWLVPLETEDRESADKIHQATAALVQRFVENPYHTGVVGSTSLISVDAVRLLSSRFGMKSQGVRTVIIPDADCMNEASANALLKTLEEVPPDTYFILTTSSRSSLLKTIQSRCLPLQLPILHDSEIASILAQYGFNPSTPDVIGYAMGSAGKAMEGLDGQFPLVSSRVVRYTEDAWRHRISEAFFAIDDWALKGHAEAMFFLEVLGFFLSDLQRIKSGLAPRCPDMASGRDSSLWEGVPSHQIEAAFKMIQEYARRLQERKQSVSMVLQNLVLQLSGGNA